MPVDKKTRLCVTQLNTVTAYQTVEGGKIGYAKAWRRYRTITGCFRSVTSLPHPCNNGVVLLR